MRLYVVLAMAAAAAGCGRLRFDPLDDAGGGMADGSEAPDARTPAVYVSTYPGGSDLYRIDPMTLQPTLDRSLCTNLTPRPELADITLDETGELIATGFPDASMYRIDPGSSSCTKLMLNISSPLKSAQLVPAGVAGPTPAVLAASQSGNLYRLDTAAGTVQLIGSFGAVSPAGDMAWTGSQLLMTTQHAGMTDGLARVDPATGMATEFGDTTYKNVYGLAWLDGVLYGFVNSGTTITIDPTTATPIRVVSGAVPWGGAAVF